MILMNELKTTAKLVKSILEENKQARNSDSFLYLKVLDHIAERDGIFLAGMPVPYFLENMKQLGFPPFESVRRTRQKIQATFPELGACKEVEAMRSANEAEFWAYANDRGAMS
jgi:hypothetical protein